MKYAETMDNAQRFTGRVADYERYRSRYPTEEVLSLLRTWCGLNPQWQVVDIGSGTGMLAEVFLENGNAVVAVEPNDEMRAACARLTERFVKFQIVAATAEATGLPDASCSLVTAGRAFHWFDAPRALQEFRRILKPGGWLTLVAAARSRDDSEQSQAYEQLLLDHGTDYDQVKDGYRIHERVDGLFEATSIHSAELRSELQLDFAAFLGQLMSTSVAPLPGHPKYVGMQTAAQQFFAHYAVNGTLAMPMSCWVKCVQINPAREPSSTD